MPQNKTPEVYGIVPYVPGGRLMGVSTLAPASYPTNVSFEKGDYIMDPTTAAPGIWVCAAGGAGGTASFARAGSTSQTGTGTFSSLVVSSGFSAGASGAANVIAISGTNTLIGSTKSDKLAFLGASPSTQVITTDSSTVEAIRILKLFGFCTTV